MTALLIDLDGVIYEGDRPVPGASEAIAWIHENAIPHLFLTNTTSRPRHAIVDKLSRMGIRIGEQSVLTPPIAAARWLAENVRGSTSLFVAEATTEDFASLQIAPDAQTSVAAVVIGDYAQRWSFDELNRAFRLLMGEPRPVLVALGMTRYWQAEDGLRLDTAPFVTALAHASGCEPLVIGKPARTFFETALATIQATSAQTVMIGDDIKGDIAGAQAVGIDGALVRSGKFSPEDLLGDVQPDFLLDSIAELPERWEEMAAS